MDEEKIKIHANTSTSLLSVFLISTTCYKIGILKLLKEKSAYKKSLNKELKKKLKEMQTIQGTDLELRK